MNRRRSARVIAAAVSLIALGLSTACHPGLPGATQSGRASAAGTAKPAAGSSVPKVVGQRLSTAERTLAGAGYPGAPVRCAEREAARIVRADTR